MRVGQNPGKFVSGVATPERITVAIVSYIPALAGYYAQSLDILRTCLESIRASTSQGYDLLVFDNGSCAEVQDFLTGLQRGGQIQYLMLSTRNLGKGGAWNFIFSAGPGEIVAYADSDVLFRLGWLERSLELLNKFPQVGMVTGRPLRTDLALSDATISWAEGSEEAEIERGQLIDLEVFAEFDRTLGQSDDEISRRYRSTEDLLLKYRGLQAFVGASHFQFVARRESLAGLFPIPMTRPMGEVRSLDRLVNQAGLLRLCTTEPLVTHMGNVLAADAPTGARTRPSTSLLRRLSEVSVVKRALLSVYDRIFRWYFARW